MPSDTQRQPADQAGSSDKGSARAEHDVGCGRGMLGAGCWARAAQHTALHGSQLMGRAAGSAGRVSRGDSFVLSGGRGEISVAQQGAHGRNAEAGLHARYTTACSNTDRPSPAPRSGDRDPRASVLCGMAGVGLPLARPFQVASWGDTDCSTGVVTQHNSDATSLLSSSASSPCYEWIVLPCYICSCALSADSSRSSAPPRSDQLFSCAYSRVLVDR